MLTGQTGGWFTPWAILWARHRRTELREDLSRDHSAGAVGLREGHEHPETDVDQPDDDRSGNGLHRGRYSGRRTEHHKWWNQALASTIHTGFRLEFAAGSLQLQTPRRLVKLRRLFHLSRSYYLWALFSLFLIPIQCVRPGNGQAEFDRTQLLFWHGYLEKSQQESERGRLRFVDSNPQLAAKFQLLEAEAMLWRGLNQDALDILAYSSSGANSNEDIVRARTLEAVALTHLQRYPEATRRFSEATGLCAEGSIATCGGLLRARGVLAIEQGRLSEAEDYFFKSLTFARSHHDRFLEATAFLNLGVAALQSEHNDEAVDWSKSAFNAAVNLGAQDIEQNALGNLGWACFQLGDAEKALNLFGEARTTAAKLGDPDDEIKWLTTAGYVYQDRGDFALASQSYINASQLAKQISSKQNEVNTLEDLAHLSIETGKLDEATAYLRQVHPLLQANGNRLDALDVMLAQGKIAAARHQDQQAEAIFLSVEHDPDSQMSMRLGAEHEIARLYESEGTAVAADSMYRTTLNTFESERAQLKNENSKLPFLANATRIYDDYIHFLVKQGKINEALALADQSRARTLAEGLGSVANKNLSLKSGALRPTAIARKTGTTLLFYWLGDKESYLWAINSNKAVLFPLPARKAIEPLVERYRKALLGPNGTAEGLNEDGTALYRMLVAPAADLIRPDSSVVLLNDGVLSQLNFETVIVPGGHPHYWIEDAALTSAPSLHMLAAANSTQPTGGKLLLLGDAISPSPDYPELPKASYEMQQIQKHFSAQNETVFARQSANAQAYLASAPQQYSYIHFVTHGIASRTDPLDSAIILSRTGTAEESFKLYARDIIQHPIHARLVTISACYGSGTRSYVGEGLVGLSWAFLRAGAHNVIGALWEASDESTPRIMDTLYDGLEKGLSPSVALRRAKLTLVREQSNYSKPFYWAPFQIYSGL